MKIYKYDHRLPNGFKKFGVTGENGLKAHHAVGWSFSLFGVWMDYHRSCPGEDEKMEGVDYGPMIRIGVPGYVLA